MSAGKGDTPRNCFSKQFKTNYDKINWSSKKCKNCSGKKFNKNNICKKCGKKYES